MDNTITSVKRFLGRKFSEPGVQADLATHCHFKATALANDEIGLEVRRRGGDTGAACVAPLALPTLCVPPPGERHRLRPARPRR